MTISALPPITYPINKSIFPAQVDAFIPALSTFITETNATAAALNLASTNDTSVSSVLIGTGSKSYIVSAGKSYSKGMWLTIAATDSPTVNSMVGQVDSYSGTTLTVSVPANGVFGSGTLAAWTIALTAAPSTQVSAAMTPVAAAATLAASRTAQGITPNLQSIDYAFSAGALILKLNPTTLGFRSTTLTAGAPDNVANAAQITTTISSGSTGGTVSAVQSDIVLLAINNAGTMELAWTNLAGGLNLDETNLITTVAEGGAGAADSANVIYSTTARTGVAYRVIGIFRSTQTVAGTWAQAPALVQPVGGQALAAMASIGYGQTEQNVTGSRAFSTTYYNTTSKPIEVAVTALNSTTTGFSLTLNIGANSRALYTPNTLAAGNVPIYVSGIVRPGGSYSITASAANLSTWVELR